MVEENPEEVGLGAANLLAHLAIVRRHGVTPVVAINAMAGDHPSEHAAIREIAASVGVRAAVCTHFEHGGKGAVELAEAVVEAAAEPGEFRMLYEDGATLRQKVEAIATEVYGARGVDYEPAAARQLDIYERAGFGALPVCIAKTHLSISSDPSLLGTPREWRLPVREARANVGAGFVYVVCGDMRTMPGLSHSPAAERIDIDSNGDVVGLY
jgi:formate--tetrahydrofolate ligase